MVTDNDNRFLKSTVIQNQKRQFHSNPKEGNARMFAPKSAYIRIAK